MIAVDRFRRWIGVGLIAVTVIAVPFVITSRSTILMLTFTFIWAGYATAWNLFSGYTGYISFGHGLFFGIGAFTSTILLIFHDITPWIGMVIGAGLASLAAFLIGYATLQRFSGIYFGLAMLMFPLAVIPILIWQGFNQFSVPYQPERFGYMSYQGFAGYYYLAFVLLAITVVIAWRLRNSQVGIYLNAIKENETAARSLGINTFRYKFIVFGISAFISALFGTIYAQSTFFVTPETIFGINPIAQPVILSVVGGMNSVLGPLVGGVMLYPLAYFLRTSFSSTFPGIHNVFYGIILIVIVLAEPEGLYFLLRQWLANRFDSD